MAVRQLLVSTGVVVGVTLLAASAASAMVLRAPAGTSSRVQLTKGKGIAIIKSNDGTAYGRVVYGRITIVVPRVVYFKRFTKGSQPGFAAD